MKTLTKEQKEELDFSYKPARSNYPGDRCRFWKVYLQKTEAIGDDLPFVCMVEEDVHSSTYSAHYEYGCEPLRTFTGYNTMSELENGILNSHTVAKLYEQLNQCPTCGKERTMTKPTFLAEDGTPVTLQYQGQDAPKVVFESWPKIPRHNNLEITITEKIDGTNACIIIENSRLIGCQSRKRLITPQSDNMGFARWAYENEEALCQFLGDGRHYGEWAGPGIQKNPRKLKEKTFFLFHSYRWDETLDYPPQVSNLPILYRGPYTLEVIPAALSDLQKYAEAKEYKAEGVVIFYHDTRSYEKATFENQKGKWTSEAVS